MIRLATIVLFLIDAATGLKSNPGAIRVGSCSHVTEVMTTVKRKDLSILPLNLLLIELDKPTFVYPPPRDGPIIVDIGLYVLEITELDPGMFFAMHRLRL